MIRLLLNNYTDKEVRQLSNLMEKSLAQFAIEICPACIENTSCQNRQTCGYSGVCRDLKSTLEYLENCRKRDN